MNRYSMLAFGVLWVILLIISLPVSSAVAADVSADEDSGIDIVADEQAGVFASLKLKKGSNIRDFLKELGDYWHRNIVPSKDVSGPVSINLYDVTYQEALEAVLNANGFAYEEDGPFIFVYTAKEMAIRKANARKMESRVFRLNYITAADVTTLIEPILSDNATTANSPSGGGGAEDWAGNNFIIIRDYPEILEEIAEMISQMDQRPPQVLVEATILSARLSDLNQLGIDFNVLAGANFQADAGVVAPLPGGAPGDGTDVVGTTISATTGPGGLSIGIVKNNIGLFIEALETITDTVTLGNPKVLTLNRQEAEVKVGGEQGYLTSESTATSTTQSVETLETGIILRFTPFVMDDGYIRLELHPEDSSGEVVLKGAFALPVKTTAEVKTNVVVKDGSTIVIGGLFRDETSISRSQVPFIGNIPLLGHLFRSTTDTVEREELIFLITPHIVREPEYTSASKDVLHNFEQRILGIREGLMGTGCDRLAAAHYNLAKEHQAAGRMGKALWDASLAATISPVFLDAALLRDELRHDKIYQGEFGSLRLFIRTLIEEQQEQSSAAEIIDYDYGSRSEIVIDYDDPDDVAIDYDDQGDIAVDYDNQSDVAIDDEGLSEANSDYDAASEAYIDLDRDSEVSSASQEELEIMDLFELMTVVEIGQQSDAGTAAW